MSDDQRPGPQSDEFVRRVRAWPVSSWRHGNRIVLTRRALETLAALAATARGADVPAVPPLAAHALADQLAVLIADARAAGASPSDLDAVLTGLRADLGLR